MAHKILDFYGIKAVLAVLAQSLALHRVPNHMQLYINQEAQAPKWMTIH